MVKNPPAMQQTWVRFLGREDPLEKEMATHSSIFAWRIPWTKKPGRLQSMGSRVRHNLVTCQQDNAQNSSNEASTICEMTTPRCSSWIQKTQRKQRSNCQHPLDHRKSKEIPPKIYFCFIDYTKAFDCVDHNKLEKILQEMGIPDHLTCSLRNLYAGQEATVRTRHGTIDCFKLGKGVHQGYILSPFLPNLYAECIM